MPTASLTAVVTASTGAASGALASFGKQIDGLAKTSDSSLAKVSKSFSTVGTNLTKFVSLPLAAAGAASVKMALDFEDAFTKIAAGSNLTATELEGMKQSVLDLAGETAKSPQELADALYFLASSGLDASQVMDALRVSAMASASGFGETSTLAQLTAVALNNYADSGLTATGVMDTLTAAIQAGTAAPEEYAGALGRILPIAAKAGVSFDEVTASLAALSNIGLDVNEGVTAMRGLLTALIAPGSQAAKAMKDLGISTDEMRAAIADNGLLGALQLLETATGGNIDKLKKIIPNVRALTGDLGLTGESAAAAAGVFDDLKSTTGELDTAFAKTKDGPMFAFRQALVDLQVAAIELGTKLIPIAVDIAQFVGKIATAFSNLSPGVQSAVIKFGALALVAGPLLKIFGGLIGIGVKLAGMFTSVAAAAATSAVSSAAAGAAASNLSFGFVSAAENAGAVATSTTAASGALGVLGVAAIGVAAGVGLLAIKYKLAADLAKANDKATTDMAAALLEGKGTAKELTDQIIASAPAFARDELLKLAIVEVQKKVNEGLVAYKQSTEDVIGPLTAEQQALVDAAIKAGDYARAVELLNSFTKLYFASLQKMPSAHQQTADAAKQDALEHEGLRGAMERLNAPTKQEEAALKTLANAHYSASNAAIDQEVHNKGLATALGGTSSASSGASGKLKTLSGDHQTAGAAANTEKGQVDGLNTSLGNIPPTKSTKITAPALPTLISQANTYATALGNIDTRIDSYIVAHYSSTGTPGRSGGIQLAEGAVFPRYATGRRFMGSVGPFVAGDGSYPTPFGTGGEIVSNRGVMPLSNQVMDRLGEAIGRRVGNRGSGPTINVYVENAYGAADLDRKVVEALTRSVGGRMPL